jgi:hypothetical protein
VQHRAFLCGYGFFVGQSMLGGGAAWAGFPAVYVAGGCEWAWLAHFLSPSFFAMFEKNISLAFLSVFPHAMST